MQNPPACKTFKRVCQTKRNVTTRSRNAAHWYTLSTRQESRAEHSTYHNRPPTEAASQTIHLANNRRE
eukprot:2168258-Pyramimonas_sp.AAC.1